MYMSRAKSQVLQGFLRLTEEQVLCTIEGV